MPSLQEGAQQLTMHDSCGRLDSDQAVSSPHISIHDSAPWCNPDETGRTISYTHKQRSPRHINELYIRNPTRNSRFSLTRTFSPGELVCHTDESTGVRASTSLVYRALLVTNPLGVTENKYKVLETNANIVLKPSGSK